MYNNNKPHPTKFHTKFDETPSLKDKLNWYQYHQDEASDNWQQSLTNFVAADIGC